MTDPQNVLITGGGGFLGVAVAELLLKRFPGVSITCSDLFQHPRLGRIAERVHIVEADLTDADACRSLITADHDCIFHFASLVSGGAEQDFRAGLEANVLATINLFEAAREAGGCPRMVFPSSIATFGGERLPSTIDDWTHQHPQNSYGVAKVIGEQLLNDYTRKGYVDGRGVRLPAIIVRDEPNTAVSGFASGLIREPLGGIDYACPVGEATRIPLLSSAACARLLVELALVDGEALGDYRSINGPSISPSAAEIAAAVHAFANQHGRTMGAITFEPEPAIESIVAAWPRVMKAERAAALGLTADASIEAIVTEYAAMQALA